MAQHGSFSRAAEALFITPSGLSLLIRELENQLGFRLFDRTTRHVQLTALGSELLQVTRRSVQDLDAVIARLGQTARGVTRFISVGVTPLVAANVLPQAIREFRGQRPDLRIQLYDGDLKAILRRVEAGKLDVGLGIFQKVPGVKRTSCFRFSLILIRAEQNGTAARPAVSWAALDGQPLISLAADNSTQQFVDQELARAGVTCPRHAVVNLLDTQIALVEANEGVAIIPSFGLPVARHRTSSSIPPSTWTTIRSAAGRSRYRRMPWSSRPSSSRTYHDGPAAQACSNRATSIARGEGTPTQPPHRLRKRRSPATAVVAGPHCASRARSGGGGKSRMTPNKTARGRASP